MCAALYATSRRQSAVVGQKRPYTSLGGRFECSGRGHGRTQPFLHWPETATTHATSSLWCDVVRGRSTEREAASHGVGSTHRIERIESTNQIGSHGRVHLSNPMFTAHTNLPVFCYFTVLMCSCRGWQYKCTAMYRQWSVTSPPSSPSRLATRTSPPRRPFSRGRRSWP